MKGCKLQLLLDSICEVTLVLDRKEVVLLVPTVGYTLIATDVI